MVLSRIATLATQAAPIVPAAENGTLRGDLLAVILLFGAALAAAWIMGAVRLPAILGFLAAGVLIGPSSLGLIDQQGIQFFAELGLAMLLFTVGLELSPEPLIRVGRRLVLATILQMGIVAAVAGGLMLALAQLSWAAAAVIGLAAAVSSTAIVLKHLSDRGEIDTPLGALIAGIVLLQDVLILLALVILPLLGRVGATWMGAALRITLALGGLVGATLVARLLMPWLVRQLFRGGGRELMTLFAVLMACLGAWLASLADWSWALGSFVAGLLLAQTDLRHQFRAEITPFRDAFTALFFISVGMLVDLRLFATHGTLLIGAVVGTVVLKALLTSAAVQLAGWPLRLSISAGLALCTVSEFAYVLAREAARQGMISPTVLDLLIAWTVGTMFVGTVIVPVATQLAAVIARTFQPPHAPAAGGSRAGPAGHVVIVGYGVNGRNLARVLRAVGIPYVVIEMHPSTAAPVRQDNPHATLFVADATRRAILEQAGLQNARALVISIADFRATRTIVAQAHALHPGLYILARTRFVAEIEMLQRLGARRVIPEEFETSIEIFAHVLKEFRVPDNVIDQQVALVRAGQYGMLRGRVADRTTRTEWLQLLESAVTQTFLVQAGSPACGKTIRALDLRAQTGVTIVAVTRAGKPTANPEPDFMLQENDVLVLVGSHRQLDNVRAALEPAGPEEPADDGKAART